MITGLAIGLVVGVALAWLWAQDVQPPPNPLREYSEFYIDGHSWSRPAHPDQKRGEGPELEKLLEETLENP